MSKALPDQDGTPARPSWWRLPLKILISVVLLGVLISHSDPAKLWAHFREAAFGWIVLALGLYLLMIFASAWRWGQLLWAQRVNVGVGLLVRSYLVATFFNNFLPSNIGGDVIRIRDTVPSTGSKTMAATIVLLDRGIGLLGLLLVAAAGATIVTHRGGPPFPIKPPVLWAVCGGGILGLVAVVLAPTQLIGLLAPLKGLRADWEEWIEVRLNRLIHMFDGYRAKPGALVNCFAGALVVQAILVGFYSAVATSLRIPIPAVHLAILVPLSFIVQMVPVSMNGFGVREATFTYYFRLLGLPLESALVLSLMGTATIMLFSLSGAAAYMSRR